MRILLTIAVAIILTTGLASQELARIDVIAHHDLTDLSKVEIKTYDLVYHGHDEGGNVESMVLELLKNDLSKKGFVYVNEKPEALIQVLVWSSSDDNPAISTSDDSESWPNIVRGKIESEYSIKVTDPEEIEEDTSEDFKYIQLFLARTPHSEGPSGLIWMASAVYKGNEADISSLAPGMIEQMLLEYPEASELPKSREIQITMEK